jgi:hypothetical protein
MGKKRHIVESIVAMLRAAEVLIGKGHHVNSIVTGAQAQIFQNISRSIALLDNRAPFTDLHHILSSSKF